MTDEQIAAVKGNVAHLPTMLGAVVLTYNLPALGASVLRLNAATVADIFLGKITRWDDARIAALNPGAKLPKADLIVVHRSDGSGTTCCRSCRSLRRSGLRSGTGGSRAGIIPMAR